MPAIVCSTTSSPISTGQVRRSNFFIPARGTSSMSGGSQDFEIRASPSTRGPCIPENEAPCISFENLHRRPTSCPRGVPLGDGTTPLVAVEPWTARPTGGPRRRQWRVAALGHQSLMWPTFATVGRPVGLRTQQIHAHYGYGRVRLQLGKYRLEQS